MKTAISIILMICVLFSMMLLSGCGSDNSPSGVVSDKLSESLQNADAGEDDGQKGFVAAAGATQADVSKYSSQLGVRMREYHGRDVYGYTYNGSPQDNLFYNEELTDTKTDEMYIADKREGFYMLSPGEEDNSLWYTYRFTKKLLRCTYTTETYLSNFTPVVCLKAGTPLVFE